MWNLSEAAAPRDMLFCDSVGHVEALVVEGKTNSGLLKFRGKFQEANAVNKNKRMYTYDILSKNVERLQDALEHRGLIGELDHPTDSIVHFDKASHVITKLWWEGNVLMGEGEILPTPHGRILQGLIEHGIRTGMSSRGIGNGQVNNEGVMVIGESYKLITFDAVADPSTTAAYFQAVKKNEAITSIPIIDDKTDDNRNKSSVKNEAQSINTTDTNALVAYLGKYTQTFVRDFKQERFN